MNSTPPTPPEDKPIFRHLPNLPTGPAHSPEQVEEMKRVAKTQYNASGPLAHLLAPAMGYEPHSGDSESEKSK